MAEKRLFKEYNQLTKKKGKYSNHQILSLSPDDDDIFTWSATICKDTKKDSMFYYGGKWILDIKVSNLYPINPPVISFNKKTPISHPNINFDTGEICLDILKSGSWSPAWDIEHLVIAILMLIDDPEPDSPLNIDLANLYRHDKVAFESFAQYIIWKYGTLNGPRDKQGLKQDQDLTIDKQAELSIETVNTTNVIKDVGKQVTKEFIDKVDEIKHSKQNSFDLSDSEENYNNAKKQIADKVSKQVEQLVSRSESPVEQEPVEIKSIDATIEDEKEKFLREVNNKVKEFTDRQKDANGELAGETQELFVPDPNVELEAKDEVSKESEIPQDSVPIPEVAVSQPNKEIISSLPPDPRSGHSLPSSETLVTEAALTKPISSPPTEPSPATISPVNSIKKSLSLRSSMTSSGTRKRDKLRTLLKKDKSI